MVSEFKLGGSVAETTKNNYFRKGEGIVNYNTVIR